MVKVTGILSCSAGVLFSVAAVNAAEEKIDPAALDFFENKIRPVLVESCYDCHSQDSDSLKGGLFLDTRDGLLQGAVGLVRLDVAPQTLGAHLLGTARMGDDPRTSVVDRFHRAHDVPNLFIVDGSVFPTSLGVNPQLTIMALAWRTSDYIIAQRAQGAV